MAVSIVSNFTSGKFYPVNNNITATVNSSNNGNCNFRYIADIYVNGTKVFTSKLFPDPSTGYGFFQLERVLQDYISESVPAITQTLGGFYSVSSATAPNTMLSVYVKFGEEYDTSSTCDGTVVQYLNQTTSNTFYVFNGAIDYESFPSWDYTKYRMQYVSTGTTKFLTNAPREMDIQYDDSYYLDFYSATAPLFGNTRIFITAYYKVGGTNTFEIPVGGLNAYRLYRIACGPYDINNYFNAMYINQWVDKYTIKLTTSGYVQLSEEFTFNLKVPREYKTRIGFIGRLGAPEYFTFWQRIRSHMTSIERRTSRICYLIQQVCGSIV
jgi:hypothetical protein